MAGYILITGGELRNKGAQAMTFTVASEMRKRYPSHIVALISNADYARDAREKANYRFQIRRAPGGKSKYILQSRLLTRCMMGNRFVAEQAQLLAHTDAIIDVSGYAFGSNWGIRRVLSYLLMLRMGVVWKIPTFIMPQSFGPFDFPRKYRHIVKLLAKNTLNRVSVIASRERSGKECLEKTYGIRNVLLSQDIVLQNTGLTKEDIYVAPDAAEPIPVSPNSVAIIPNRKNETHGDARTITALYERIIRLLLDRGKTVYLIYHALEDAALCGELKRAYFPSDARVVYIDRELSCFEYETMAKALQFVVASRYHSIVHSYKTYTPAVIIGWAEKYRALAESMRQEAYCFDVRGALGEAELLSAVAHMCDAFPKESDVIEKCVRAIQTQTLFDRIALSRTE